MLMNSSIFSWLLIPGLLILFFLFGSFITCRKKLGSFSIIDTLLIGFFLYFGLFQIFALPMKVLLMPLSYLCISWLIFVTIAVVDDTDFCYWCYHSNCCHNEQYQLWKLCGCFLLYRRFSSIGCYEYNRTV